MIELDEHSLSHIQAEGYPLEKWFTTHNPIEELLDPNWKPHSERLLQEYNVLATNPKWSGAGKSLDLGRLLGERGSYNSLNTVLDVGGGNGAEPFTLLRQFPFYFILDPTVGEIVEPIHPHRAIRGYAENMPFRDQSFYWVLSHRSVGWYADIINPYWALCEMIRVAQEKINITIGQDVDRNKTLLLEALAKIKNTPKGNRIRDEAIRPTELALLLDH